MDVRWNEAHNDAGYHGVRNEIQDDERQNLRTEIALNYPREEANG
jgi:hypothetical protein